VFLKQLNVTLQDLEMPDVVYQIDPRLQESAEMGAMRKYQFGDDGTLLSTGGSGPATLSLVSLLANRSR
jgi:hypothetical protein